MTTDFPPVRRNPQEPLRCPNDQSRLVEVDRAGILVDACPECRGVWLDRGELDRILVAERRGAAASVTDQDDDFLSEVEGRPGRRRDTSYQEHGQEQSSSHGRRKGRRRSMLEDLFDF